MSKTYHRTFKALQGFFIETKKHTRRRKDTILVSMNVKSLYTNIPIPEGIEVVKEKLNAESEKPIATKAITKLLLLILILNNFIFNRISYLQK